MGIGHGVSFFCLIIMFEKKNCITTHNTSAHIVLYRIGYRRMEWILSELIFHDFQIECDAVRMWSVGWHEGQVWHQHFVHRILFVIHNIFFFWVVYCTHTKAEFENFGESSQSSLLNANKVLTKCSHRQYGLCALFFRCKPGASESRLLCAFPILIFSMAFSVHWPIVWWRFACALHRHMYVGWFLDWIECNRSTTIQTMTNRSIYFKFESFCEWNYYFFF